MSYNDALRQVIADEVNRERERYTRYERGEIVRPPVVHPNDIVGIDCTWDNGSNYDPTYPSSPTPPTFTFQVRLRHTKAGIGPGLRPWPAEVSVSFLMGALLNTILETEL